MMKIIRISHLGLAPKNSKSSLNFFQNILGLQYQGCEDVHDQLVKVCFLQCENTRLELLEPTSSQSAITKFLESKGSGIHHVALEVDSIEEWLNYLKKNGVQLIDETPRFGAHNTKIVFIHPKSTGGILVELVEEQK